MIEILEMGEQPVRKYAFITDQSKIQKVMIYENDQDVYLFTYDTKEDLPCIHDYWFDNLEEAEEYCSVLFGDGVLEWIDVEDPGQEEAHDLIISRKQ